MDEKLTYYHLRETGRDGIATAIRNALSKDDNIILALMFGSILRRNAVRDIDIAVYADPEPDLAGLLELSSKLERSVGIPVDVSPLSKLEPCMRYRVMAGGVRILIRNERLFNELLHSAFSECQEVKLLLRQAVRKG